MNTSICGLLVVLGLLAGAEAEAARRLQQRFAWRALDWAFPGRDARDQALRSGEFIPENALPVGIELWGDKLFVTVPRWRQGIPATLNYISLSKSNEESPQLIPYPDWSTNREGNCNGITTTYRIKADACNRLWVLDTGTVGIGNTTENVCPYSLLAFDLTTDKLLRRYQYQPADTNDRTFIANIAVDIGKSCEDTYVYASDELGYGLIVYSWEQNTSWRVTHSFFMPDPLRGDFNIAGLNFQWGTEGIFGLSLSPIESDGFRTLFFHPLASYREFAVSTKILRNKELAGNSYHDFVVLDERGPNTHVTASFMDDEGIMYYNLVDQNAVGCWNSRNPYLPQYHDIIDKDDVGLVFPSDVKIDANRNIWVMSDRMPVFLEAELDFKDVNFRIYVAPVDHALAGTVCAHGVHNERGFVSQANLHNPLLKHQQLSIPPPKPVVAYHTIPQPRGHQRFPITSFIPATVLASAPTVTPPITVNIPSGHALFVPPHHVHRQQQVQEEEKAFATSQGTLYSPAQTSVGFVLPPQPAATPSQGYSFQTTYRESQDNSRIRI